MNISFYIISISLGLQLISVFLTFRLIVYQGKRTAGTIILLTIVFMVLRRIISLYRALEVNEIKTDLYAEIVGCAVSALLLAGIIFIGRLLSSIRTLSGLLPICLSCKKIRDEKGHWKQVEMYIEEHSKAEFSHGLCPDCGKKFQAEIIKFKKNNEHGQT